MDDRKFRLAIVALFSIAVIGHIVNGFLASQNGRYIQYDFQRDHVIFENTMSNPTPKVLDTRTGKTSPARE